MQLSITTDYLADTGCPEEDLRRVAEFGFSHIHWCHHWNTDFLYAEAELRAIERWLGETALVLQDVHASHGKEKCWYSPREHERLAGVELVKNRIDFAARLGSRAAIIHISDRTDTAAWDALRRSLDEIQGYARSRRVRLALENGRDNFPALRELFGAYSADYIGLCYDSGHGNQPPEGASKAIGLDELETMKDRLVALHLHDNDGRSDQHRIPFSGTVDWARLCAIIADSSYSGRVSMECNIHQEDTRDPGDFLERALEAGARLARMAGAAP
jgi:sugar phosphate isomerase/epimerase